MSGVGDALREVTESIKDEMQDRGWYLGGRQPRYDRPTDWDVNNGMCEEWAISALEALGSSAYAREPSPDGPYMAWLEEFDARYEDYSHCVVYLNGKYYDAQVPDGVDALEDLPLLKGIPRAPEP